MKYLFSHFVTWTCRAMLTFALVALFAHSSATFAAELTAEQAQTFGVTQIEDTTVLGQSDVRETVARIINVALGLLGVIALSIVLYGGFLWMTAGGNEEQIGKAKQWMINGAIGLAIILSAFSIVWFVLSKLAGATKTGENGGLGGGGGGGLPGGQLCNNPPCDGGAFVVKISPRGEVEPQNVVAKLYFQKNGKPATVDRESVKFGENVKLVQITDQSEVAVPFEGQFLPPSTIHLLPKMSACNPPGPATDDCLTPGLRYKVSLESSIKRQGSSDTLVCGAGLADAFACRAEFTAGQVFDNVAPAISIVSPQAADTVPFGAEVPLQVRATDDHGISSISYAFNGRVEYINVFDGNQKEVVDEYTWFVDEETYPAGQPIQVRVVVWDVDGHAQFALMSIIPRPAHCGNGVQDGGETGIDVGGGCGNGGGGACVKPSDCASGVCQNGRCVDVPRIDAVTPGQASPGGFVTISGRFFGAAQNGARMCLLQDELAESCEGQIPISTPAQCGASVWSDDQIIIEVPQVAQAEGNTRALDLDGVGEYAYIEHINSEGLKMTGTSVTLEAFVTYEGSAPHGGDMFILSRGQFSDAPNYGLFLTPQGNLGFTMLLDSGLISQVTDAKVPNDGRLHHVAAVYDGSAVRWYIDGVEQRRFAIQGTMLAEDNVTAIGAFSSRNQNYYKGLIHSVAVWSSALSAPALNAHAGQGIPLAPAASGQRGFWRFSQTLFDRSEGRNNLTGVGIEPADYVSRVRGIGSENGLLKYPVRVERTVAGTVYGDATNDLRRGKYLPDVLKIDQIKRPSLCSIDPRAGVIGTRVVLDGKDFGDDQGNRAIVFGERVVQREGAWTATSLATKVPNVAQGPASVYIVDGNERSNAVTFRVQATAVSEMPVVESLDPPRGTVGQYITVRGKNFGTNPQGAGVVVMEVNDPAVVAQLEQQGKQNFFLADTDFPPQCAGGTWTPQSIVIKVPTSLRQYVGQGLSVNVYVRLSSEPAVLTNAVPFSIVPGNPPPGVCAISPSNGPLGTSVKLFGEGLRAGDNQERQVYFWKEGADASRKNVEGWVSANNATTLWNADGAGREISTRVPGDGSGAQPDAQTGPVFAARVDQVGAKPTLSNTVPFTVYDCTQNNNSCPANLFGEGVQCCATGKKKGSCLAACEDASTVSEFSWRFSTGKIPLIPAVVEQCGVDAQGNQLMPSPSPWRNWNFGKPACSNVAINVLFNTDVFNGDQFVKLEKCVGQDAQNPCAQVETPRQRAQVLGGAVVRIEPLNNAGALTQLDPGASYQIRVLAGLTAAPQANRPGGVLPVNESLVASCGANTAYCYRFETAVSNGPECEVKSVVVEPQRFTALGFGVITDNPNSLDAVVNMASLPLDWETRFNPRYFATALANPDQCVVLPGQNWVWSTDLAAKAIPTGRVDRDGDGKGDEDKFIRTLEQTAPNTPVKVSAGIAGSSLSGFANLAIDLPDPRIVNAWPQCNTACINSQIAVEFNQPVNKTSFYNSTSLYRCAAADCAVKTRIPFGWSWRDANKTDSVPNDERLLVFLPGRINAAGGFELGLLDPNTYYLLQIDSFVAKSATDITFGSVAADEWNTPPFGSARYKGWRFKTKDDASACTISSATVNPSEIVTTAIGQRVKVQVDAVGSPSACGPFGVDVLDASLYDWSWSVEGGRQDSALMSSNAVAKVSNLDFGGSLPSSCTLDCRWIGATLKAPAITCGDGVVNGAEECEPSLNNACSGSCLLLGNISVITCGNGVVQSGSGESCDDGNRVSGDGCSAVCLVEGAGTRKVAQSVCGDRSVDIDEACDDGNAVSGDGCSSRCLKEGTPPLQRWCSQRCDQARTRCSAAGPATLNREVYPECASAVAVCGNGGIPEEGEACDDGNTVNGDGCSERCLHEGSLPVAQDGTCGNGVRNNSEDCDDGNTANGDGCSERCLVEGSSLAYSVASVCGDAIMGAGEQCEAPTRSGDGRTDAEQFVEAVGRGPLDDGGKQSTIVSVTEKSTPSKYSGRADASFALQCGFAPQAECPQGSAYGVGNNSCCMLRPVLSNPFPTAGDSCLNTFIYINVNQDVDVRTLLGNVEVVRVANGCAQGETEGVFMGDQLGQQAPRPWWWRLKEFFANAFFKSAIAAEVRYCSGSVAGDVSFEVSGEQRRIVFKLNKPLQANQTYAVRIKGGAQGVKSVDGVGLRSDLFWDFRTGTAVCTLDKVVSDPLSWVFSATVPGTGVACAYDSDCDGGGGSCYKTNVADATGFCRHDQRTFTMRALSTSGGVEQEIVPLPGVYAWNYEWLPQGNSSPVVRVSPAVVNPTALVAAKSNGSETLVLTASTTENAIARVVPWVVRQTTANVDVFVCDNPWPAADAFPYKDIVLPGQNKRDNPVANFSLFYCRDKGIAGIDDDMPALVPSVVYPTHEEYAADLFKQFYFLNPGGQGGAGKNDLIGLRVHKNDDMLNLAEWYALERPNDPGGITENMTVNGYPAARVDNTVYVNVADETATGQLSGKVFVISVGGAPGTTIHPDTQKIFNDFLKNIQFNRNIISYPYCRIKGSETLLPGANRCTSDFSCPLNQECLNTHDKLRRDFARIFDLQDLTASLSDHFSATTVGRCGADAQKARTNNHRCVRDADCTVQGERCFIERAGAFPTLKETSNAVGSFLPFMTTSKWQSWQGALGNMLGVPVPTDPLNVFGVSPANANDLNPANRCGRHCSVNQNLTCAANADCPSGEVCLPDNGFDASTCWNEKEQAFLCPSTSQIYRYGTDARGSVAEIYMNFEYQAPWSILTGQNAFRAERKYAPEVRWILGSACSNQTLRVQGFCGDGSVNPPAEQCEAGMTAPGQTCRIPANTVSRPLPNVSGIRAWDINDKTVDPQFRGSVMASGGHTFYYKFNVQRGVHTFWIETFNEFNLSAFGGTVAPDSPDAFCADIQGVQHHIKIFVDKNKDGDMDDNGEYLGDACNDAVPLSVVGQHKAFFNTGLLEAGEYEFAVQWDNDWNMDVNRDGLLEYRVDNDSNISISQVGLLAEKKQACETATCTWAPMDLCTSIGTCGDGIIQSPEVCDDGTKNGQHGGYCNAVCGGKTGFCGNTVIDQGEFCDPTALMDDPRCTTGDIECVFTKNRSIRCHVGGIPGLGFCVPRLSEEQSFTVRDIWALEVSNSCRWDCRGAGPYCGDGKIDAPFETCDDGNRRPADGCSAACVIENATRCGNGVVDAVDGEECDDGNGNGSDGCSSTCKIERAFCGRDEDGDGQMRDPGEVCDDGAFNGIPPQDRVPAQPCPPGQQCSYCATDCSAVLNITTQAFCGNGVVDRGEQCDWGVGYCRNNNSWSCVTDSDCTQSNGTTDTCVGRVTRWVDYMASSTAIAVGLDNPRDRSQDWWCIDVDGGYVDYPARCTQDCSAVQCIQRVQGVYRIQPAHTKCNENSQCSKVDFSFSDIGSAKDDLFRVTLRNEDTRKTINLAQRRIDYALSRNLSPAIADQWGFWGPPWNMNQTRNLQPQPDTFQFTPEISKDLRLGHLPVGVYTLTIDSIYDGTQPGTFSLQTVPANGVVSEYNIQPLYQYRRRCSLETALLCNQNSDCGVTGGTCVLAPQATNSSVLDRFDYLPDLSSGLNSNAEFLADANETCFDPDATAYLYCPQSLIDNGTCVRRNPNNFTFPNHYEFTASSRLPAPAVCPVGSPKGKAVYQFMVVPRNLCGNGVVDEGEQCDQGRSGGATCTPLCRNR